MNISELQTVAAYLLNYSCAGGNGRDENDPVYQRITEGRDKGSMQRSYSSCADLGHWLLYRLGCRESWINREENNGWRSQINLNRLHCRPIGGCPVAKRPMISAPAFEPGDVLCVSNAWGGHVMCVTGQEESKTLPGSFFLHTAEFGQPGGVLKVRPLTDAFRKTITSVLRLRDVPLAAPVDLEPLRSWLSVEQMTTLESFK